MNHAAQDALPSFTVDGPSFIPASAAKPVEEAKAEPSQPEPEGENADDPLILAGEKVFKKCKACHAVGPGAKNKSGPHLNGIIGRTMGSIDGFAYSGVFKTAFTEGRVWDAESLAEFLAKPKSYMKGTKMAFSGLKKDADLAAIAAYLGTFEGE
jgi:cytochrome c